MPEYVLEKQFQCFLYGIAFLDQCQSGFRPNLGREIALVDAFRREINRKRVSLLILSHLSAVFDTANHGILLGYHKQMPN